MSGNDSTVRKQWLAIILLGGLAGAGIVFALFRELGEGAAVSFGVGGATFLGLVTLGLAARRFLTD